MLYFFTKEYILPKAKVSIRCAILGVSEYKVMRSEPNFICIVTKELVQAVVKTLTVCQFGTRDLCLTDGIWSLNRPAQDLEHGYF